MQTIEVLPLDQLESPLSWARGKMRNASMATITR
jgi:hypothetical protein